MGWTSIPYKILFAARWQRVCSFVIFFVAFTQITFAQGPIFLPLVVKGDCDMAILAKLEITDGTTTINLLTGSRQTGFNLRNWDPTVIQPKSGGVFQDSPIAPGRRLVFTIDATAIEDFTVDINDYDQDSLIAQAQDLMRLLLKARDFQTTEAQPYPVWIRARSNCETNDRYALIINWAIPQLSNPYAQPFVSATEIATMDEISVQLERGHWLANLPGTGISILASNSQTWRYSDKWNLFDHLAAVPDLPAPTDRYIPVAISTARVVVAPTDNGAADDMYISTDQGATWAAVAGGSNVEIYDALKISNSNVLFSEASNGKRILQSTDQGSSVSVLSTDVGGGPIIQLTNGNLMSADSDDIYLSTDGGSNWSIIGAIGTGTVRSLKQSPTTGTIIATVNIGAFGTRDQLYRSTDLGITWSLVYSSTSSYLNGTYTGAQVLAVDKDSIFYQIIVSGADTLLSSTNDGLSWFVANTSLVPSVYSIFVDSNNELYLFIDTGGGGHTYVYRSIDQGENFTQEFDTGGEFFPFFTSESDDGDYYVGGENKGAGLGGLIYSLADDVQDFGSSTDDRLDITNHQNIAQLSHIYIDDGGVFGLNLFPVAAAFDMYPAVPVVNDAIYFGIESSLLNSGPFAGLRFEIDSPLIITGVGAAVTIDWEYWNGAWVALTIRDNTAVGDAFDQIGINSVHWKQPSDWTTTAVNGVTGYWVRANISATGGTITPPTHADADIFTFNLPYISVASTEILGDIPALAQIKAQNQSDFDGPGNYGPDLYENRLVVGLRSYGRGNDFQAYINLADEQNPVDITIAAGTNTTFATDTMAPTGRRMTYNPAGIEAMATRATISLGPTIARDFYGTFHAFLRARRTAGASTDLSVRLQVATGSGGIQFTTATSKQLQTTTAFEVLDFGEISLPVSGSFLPTDLADTTEIRIQASAASGTPDLYLYDLILIPVDEWAVDAVDKANEDDSDVGRSGDISKLLDIDSVTDPRIDIKTLVRMIGNELITAEYDPITNGGAILQANAQQRLWFFAMQTSTTGSSYYWIAPPEIAHSIQVYKNERYLGQRGAR
jgi:hypothetical protein